MAVLRLFIFAALVLGPARLFAASAIISCDGKKAISTERGEKILGDVQDRYSGISSLKAQFLQDSFLEALETSELSSGVVWFSKPGQMRWEYEDPEAQLFLLKDRTLWFYQESQKQALVDRVDDVLLSDLPVAFLLGLGDLKRDFKLEKGCVTDDGIVLELVVRAGASTRKDEGLKRFQLLVSADSNLPQGARVTDVGGNVTSIILRELNVNPEIASDLYAAKFPKGTDIQDRRAVHGGEKHE